MKIHLIIPAWGQTRHIKLYQGTPPLGLAYIAAVLLEDGHEVKITDGVLEGWQNIMPYGPILAQGLHNNDLVNRIESDTDIIGISVMSTVCWPLVIDLCERLKQAFPEIPIVLGGEHPSAIPKFCLLTSVADVVVLGEGEATMRELTTVLGTGDPKELHLVKGLAFIENGTYIETASRPRIRDLDSLPLPAWHILDIDRYQDDKLVGVLLVNNKRTLPLLASRGCPHLCTFCTSAGMWGRKWIPRKPQAVVDEMAHHLETYNVTDFILYDLTTGARRDWMEELCREIIDRQLDISWHIGTRVERLDDNLALLMKQSGLDFILLAPESASERTRTRIKKHMKQSDIDRAIRACAKAGLSMKVQVMSGLPGDTHRDAWANIFFAAKLGYANVGTVGTAIFAPYPGTEAFDDLLRKGELEFNDETIIFTVGNNDFVKPLLKKEKLGPYTVKFYQFAVLGTFMLSKFICHPVRSFRALLNALTSDVEHDHFEKLLKMVIAAALHPPSSKTTGEPIPWPKIDYERFSHEDIVKRRNCLDSDK